MFSKGHLYLGRQTVSLYIGTHKLADLLHGGSGAKAALDAHLLDGG